MEYRNHSKKSQNKVYMVIDRCLEFIVDFYEKIASLFSNNGQMRLSILGAIIIVAIMFLHNMAIVTLLNIYIPFFKKTGNVIWDVCWALGIFLLAIPLFSYKGRANSNEIKINKPLLFSLTIFMVFFAISGITSTWGRMKLVLIYFCLFLPIVYQLKRTGKEIISETRLILKIISFLGLIYFTASYFWVPFFDETRYLGLSLNANGLGQIATCILISTLIESHYSNKILSILYGSIAGISFYFIIISASRTSFLILSLILLAGVIYLLFKKSKKAFLLILKSTVIIGASLFITINLFQYQLKLFSDPIHVDNFYFQTLKEIVNKETNDQNNLTVETNNQNEKIKKDRPPQSVLAERFHVDENISDGDFYYFEPKSDLYHEIDKLTTHRLSIWESFLKETKLLGQSSRIIQYDRYHSTRTAHQLFIQIAFDIGLIGGVVYLIFFILNCFCFLKILFGKQDNIKNLFYTLAFVNYFALGLVASNCYSNVYLSSFMFYLALIPIMIDKGHSKEYMSVKDDKCLKS